MLVLNKIRYFPLFCKVFRQEQQRYVDLVAKKDLVIIREFCTFMGMTVGPKVYGQALLEGYGETVPAPNGLPPE
jgi:hypothetical protein